MPENTPEVGKIEGWLLEGDPAIRWQVLRDLMNAPAVDVGVERARVANEGWGAQLLALQDPDGRWGGGLYSRKWTSTTYTLILLRRLGLPAGHPQALRGLQVLLDASDFSDGGIDMWRTSGRSDACVNAMILAVAAHFDVDDPRVTSLLNYLLEHQMDDGGWNCEDHRGATHSSFHTTLSALEGLHEWQSARGPDAAIETTVRRGEEFLLSHRLYRSHRTGEVVSANMTRFSFPPRWFYDVLRALDYFQARQAALDPRMEDALVLLRKKRHKDGFWKLQNRRAGLTFFEMETVGQPSRWNTLRALRVLRWAGS
jgi:hypothetical protein